MEGTPNGPVDTSEQRLQALEARVAALEANRPRTNLFNVSFLKRAFTVWGHYFVANFLIGCVFAFFALIILLFVALIGGLSNL